MINGCDNVPRDLRTVVTEEILAEAVEKHSLGLAKATAISRCNAFSSPFSFFYVKPIDPRDWFGSTEAPGRNTGQEKVSALSSIL